jgi:hypothetical protein
LITRSPLEREAADWWTHQAFGLVILLFGKFERLRGLIERGSLPVCHFLHREEVTRS